MSGSFQLVEPFTPSPSILAGSEDVVESDYEADPAKDEVYVIRKTKSGRRAPLEKTQLDFSSSYKKRVPGSGGGKKTPARKMPSKKTKYASSSSEEEESSSEQEADSEVEGYSPRATKSRGARAPVAKKSQPRPTPTKAKASKSKGRGKPSSKPQKAPKRGKAAAKSPKKLPARDVNSEEEEEDRNTSAPQYAKSVKSSNSSAHAKKPPAKKRPRTPAKAEVQSDDEEDYYEIEEETLTPSKRGRVGKPGAGKSKVAAPKQSTKRDTFEPSSPSGGRTPRSASKTARKSLREADSEDESDEEYVARPSSSRGANKR